MAPQVRVLDPSPVISRPAVVTLDLIDGVLSATSDPELCVSHVLAVTTTGTVSSARLNALAPLAQQVLDGSSPDAVLTLQADEAFDALVRVVAHW